MSQDEKQVTDSLLDSTALQQAGIEVERSEIAGSPARVGIEGETCHSSQLCSMESGVVPALSAGTETEVEMESPARETEGAEVREIGALGPGRGPGRDRDLLDEVERERLALRYVMGMERGDDELIGAVIEPSQIFQL